MKNIRNDFKLLNLSPSTMNTYVYRISDCLDWCGKTNNKIKEADINEYLAHKRKTCRSSTVAAITNAIRAYFSALLKSGKIKTSPAANIQAGKVHYRPRNFLTAEEAERLLNACDNAEQSVVIALALYAGLRRSEIAALRWGDVKNNNIKVIDTKGGKSRVVPVSKHLDKYLAAKRSENDYEKIVRYNARGISNLVSKIGKRAKIKVSAHELRHTFATLLLQNDVDLNSLKELLGHTNIATTSIYLHSNPRHLRDSVNKNPVRLEVIKNEKDISK